MNNDTISLILSIVAIVISIVVFVWSVWTNCISSNAKIKTDINIWHGPELGMNLKNYGGGSAILKKCKLKYKDTFIDFNNNLELVRMCDELRIQLAYMDVSHVLVNEIHDGDFVNTDKDRSVIVVKTKGDVPLNPQHHKPFAELLYKVEIVGKYKSAYPLARLQKIDGLN